MSNVKLKNNIIRKYLHNSPSKVEARIDPESLFLLQPPPTVHIPKHQKFRSLTASRYLCVYIVVDPEFNFFICMLPFLLSHLNKHGNSSTSMLQCLTRLVSQKHIWIHVACNNTRKMYFLWLFWWTEKKFSKIFLGVVECSFAEKLETKLMNRSNASNKEFFTFYKTFQ